jgi:hypothetical protein
MSGKSGGAVYDITDACTRTRVVAPTRQG